MYIAIKVVIKTVIAKGHGILILSDSKIFLYFYLNRDVSTPSLFFSL